MNYSGDPWGPPTNLGKLESPWEIYGGASANQGKLELRCLSVRLCVYVLTVNCLSIVDTFCIHWTCTMTVLTMHCTTSRSSFSMTKWKLRSVLLSSLSIHSCLCIEWATVVKNYENKVDMLYKLTFTCIFLSTCALVPGPSNKLVEWSSYYTHLYSHTKCSRKRNKYNTRFFCMG